jgi:hypothetical protein
MMAIVVGGSFTLVVAVLTGVAWYHALRDAVAPDPVEAADESRLSWRSLCRDRLGVPAGQLSGDVTRN